MGSEIELVCDSDGLAVIGSADDVDRFFLHSRLDRMPSKKLELSRLSSIAGGGAAALDVGAELAANSGRWVKLTAESADAVREFGLMATKTPGVSHAMIGQPGDIKQWIQIAQGPSALLSGPLALTALSTIMQQWAMKQQMDQIVSFLEIIDKKIDGVLRRQKSAVIADMIGVDLIIEDALAVRDEVGRVSEVTWSKVQATSQALARTQAYALRELDAIAEELRQKAGVGEIARATKDAEPEVREWLAVMARSFQLQDGVAILELDRVLDESPDELERHRQGLISARRNRLERIGNSTATLLSLMDETARVANSKVLFNPVNSPAAVKSSNRVADAVHGLRRSLGIEAAHETEEARRWLHAAGEALEKVRVTTTASAAAATRLSLETFDRATEPFRAVDRDGDGIPDQPRAVAAAEQAGAAIKSAAAGVAGAVGNLVQRRREPDARHRDDEPGRAEPPTADRD